MNDKEIEDSMMTKMNQPTNVNLTPETMRETDEQLRQKEMDRLNAEDAAMKEMKDRMMAKMNQSANVNLTPETMREMDEHLRQKEMDRLNAEAAAKKEIEDSMMAKMNDFDYPTEEEGLSHKGR